MGLFRKNKKQKNVVKEPVSRILILRLSSIGDIVLTTPIIRCLRRQYPDATIDMLVKKEFKNVIEENPHISNIITFDGDIDSVIYHLQQQNYQYIVDLHKNIRTKRIKSALNKAEYLTFDKLNKDKWLYTNFKWNRMPKTSIVERYFQAVKELGVRNDGQGLDYFINEKDKTELEDIPLGHWSGFIGAVIGGAHATKQMPVDQWKKFVSACQYPIVLLGGASDKVMGDEIAKDAQGKVYNSCGKFNLSESADLIDRARVIVTHDTGLMHISAAFQKPIVSIWGNTTPDLGMFPYYGFNDLEVNIAPKSIIIENKNLGCRPCSKIGYEKCPKRHFKCMNQLNTNEIADAVSKLWNAAIAQEKSEGKFI